MGKERKKVMTYVIDEEYRLVYFDKELEQIYPQVELGDYCYSSFCGEEAPCSSCPIRRNSEEHNIFYNKLLRKWLEVHVSQIFWPEDSRKYTWIMSAEVNKYDGNLFARLTEPFSYDELFAANLTKKSYRILYCQDETVSIPADKGSLEELCRYNAEHFIHPADRERFLKYWDIGFLTECFDTSVGEVVMDERFRGGGTGNPGGDLEQIIIPVRRNKKGDLVAMCFLRRVEELQEQSEEELTEVDPLTGLYQRNTFFKEAEAFLKDCPADQWCLAAIDIEHFKLFNEWFGQKTGDRLLENIGKCLKEFCEDEKGLTGYFGGDDFYIIMPNDMIKINHLYHRISRMIMNYGEAAGFLPAVGVYEIDRDKLPVSVMCDRAQIAVGNIKGNYRRRIAVYDRSMIEQMEKRKRLLSDVQMGINNREFIFYVQPKCNLSTGRIVGLEALVRWKHPTIGMVSPGEFIPLLENTGLITNLDIYIWEEVCKAMKNWVDGKHQLIPMSVNVSIVDIHVIDVPSIFKRLADKYELDPKYLEIEITESAYAEDLRTVREVVQRLQSMGFTVLMDDFGSGYSSLNMLKDINVDILKMDMKFLDINEQSYGRGLNVMESIVRLANLMDLRLIAEGVENQTQIDYLKKMGCVYGQGYYFYRPMSVEELDRLLEKTGKVDFRGLRKREIGHIYARDLFTEGITSDVILNNILGAMAFYELRGGKPEIVRVNEQYCTLVGMNLVDMEDRNNLLLEYIHIQDRPPLMRAFENAYHRPLEGDRVMVRYQRENGEYIWIVLQIFFMREKEGNRLFYAAARDVTEAKRRELNLLALQEAMNALLLSTNSGSSLMHLREENRQIAATLFARMSPEGMLGGYCEEGYPLYFANEEMVQRLGYDSYEEFVEAIRGLVENIIYEEDRERVKRELGEKFYVGMEYSLTFRMMKKKGDWFWVMDKGRVVEAEDGRLAMIGACTDITEIILQQERLKKNNSNLLRENEELNYYVSLMPGAYHRYSATGDFDFLYISDRFQEMMGYTQMEIAEIFENKFLNMVHPEDRDGLREMVKRLREEGGLQDMEYRIQTARGYIWVLNQSRYLEYQEQSYVQGIAIDITDSRRQRQSLKWMAETDFLSRVMNRSAAIPRIEKYLQREHTEQAAFIIIDLDDFKRLNETLGHPGGDSAIVRCAEKIKNNFRDSDIICRLGGDEFSIFCKNIRPEEVERKLRTLMEDIAEPYEYEGKQLSLSISAGYVMAPEGGASFHELYQKADMALIRAKRVNKGGYLRYDTTAL